MTLKHHLLLHHLDRLVPHVMLILCIMSCSYICTSCSITLFSQRCTLTDTALYVFLNRFNECKNRFEDDFDDDMPIAIMQRQALKMCYIIIVL